MARFTGILFVIGTFLYLFGGKLLDIYKGLKAIDIALPWWGWTIIVVALLAVVIKVFD